MRISFFNPTTNEFLPTSYLHQIYIHEEISDIIGPCRLPFFGFYLTMADVPPRPAIVFYQPRNTTDAEEGYDPYGSYETGGICPIVEDGQFDPLNPFLVTRLGRHRSYRYEPRATPRSPTVITRGIPVRTRSIENLVRRSSSGT